MSAGATTGLPRPLVAIELCTLITSQLIGAGIAAPGMAVDAPCAGALSQLSKAARDSDGFVRILHCVQFPKCTYKARPGIELSSVM